MSKQTWVECLAVALTSGPALNTSTTNTSILPSQAKYVFPNGYIDLIGKTLRVTAKGIMTVNASAAANLTIDMRLGTNIIANTGVMVVGNTTTTQINNAIWQYECLVTALAVGNTANVVYTGQFSSVYSGIGISGFGTGNGSIVTDALFPANAITTSAAFDATASLQFDMQATWSVSNANNNIQLSQFVLEALN